jgi:hypothetical protein
LKFAEISALRHFSPDATFGMQCAQVQQSA